MPFENDAFNIKNHFLLKQLIISQSLVVYQKENIDRKSGRIKNSFKWESCDMYLRRNKTSKVLSIWMDVVTFCSLCYIWAAYSVL